MTPLLDNCFSPITDGLGFLKASLDEVVEAVFEWRCSMRPTVKQQYMGNLVDALPQLVPMNDWPILLCETPSDWTGIVQGTRFRPESIVVHMSRVNSWRGLLVECIEDSFDPKTGEGIPGGVQMMTYGGSNAEKMFNLERMISATRQPGGWEFHADGPVLPFERTDRYQSRRIRDRFTPEMLEEYCLTLGNRLFDSDFYGPRFVLIRDPRPLPEGIEAETFESMHR